MEGNEIEKLAHLARLSIDAQSTEKVADNISNVLSLVDQLCEAKIDDVAPMAHPLDAVQILREDKAHNADERDNVQGIAPATQDGLYLVPKVIE